MEYGTYFLCAALSVAAGFAAAVLRAKKSGLPAPKAALVFLAAAVLGALGARLYCVAARTLPGGILFEKAFLSDRPYDYAVCGAVIGAPLAVFLLSRALKMPSGRALDAAAFGGLIALGLERISEVFADSAWGEEILDEKWQFFPLALRDGYGDWYGAVNLLEAALALAVLLAVLARGYRRDGTAFALALLWWALSQILCESLRAETLRWGFVRVQQVQCALFGGAVLACVLIRRHAPGKAWILPWGIYLAGIGAVIALEFALDRLSWPRLLDYALMAVALAAAGTAARAEVIRTDRARGAAER